jgi:hypothetical protein
MRWAWWRAIAMIALTTPCSAQQRSRDTLDVLPLLRRSDELREMPSLISRPFVGDVIVTLVRRGEGRYGLRPITRAELGALHLTQPQAFALATRNLRRMLTPYSVSMPAASPELSGMRSVEGEFLAASRLLLTDDWRAAADALGGPLVAVVPTAASLMFGRDTMTYAGRQKSIPAAQFIELAVDMLLGYVQNDAALSATVFRWTGSEWQALRPMSAAQRSALQRGAEGEPKGRKPLPEMVASPVPPPPTSSVAIPPPKVTKSARGTPGKP